MVVPLETPALVAGSYRLSAVGWGAWNGIGEQEHGACLQGGLGGALGPSGQGGTEAGSSWIMALSEAVRGKFVLLGTKSLLRDVSGILGPVTYLLMFTFNTDLLPLFPSSDKLREWN